MKNLLFLLLFSVSSGSQVAVGWDGSKNLEAGLNPDDILLFEDFEDPEYKRNWTVHWNYPVGAGVVEVPDKPVFSGNRSAFLFNREGQHPAEGEGEYVPATAVDDVAFARLYLMLEEGFSMGTANQLKLFAMRGGADLAQTYGGAGEPPSGRNKFSATLALDNWPELHFYVYHSEQPDLWGEWFYCHRFFCSVPIKTGRWYCMEMMLRNNTPGENDGELRAWLDEKLVIKVGNLRFRDIPEMQIRRFSIISYFGGGGPENTSPKDQKVFIDNYVVSRSRVGCAVAN